MKGGDFCGLRVKHFSLTVLTLICTTILLWVWEKAPLNTLLPPQSQPWMPSPEITTSAPVVSSTSSKPDIYVKDDLKYISPEKETRTKQAEQSANVKVPVNYVTTSSPYTTDSKSAAPPVVKKEIAATVVEEDTKPNQHPEGENRAKQSEQSVDVVTPMASEITNSSVKGDFDTVLTTPLINKKACNFAKGKWVPDNRRPLYSGFDCKQWLSVMWACRLTQRTDFSYESFRWQPENCEMPEFEGSMFLRRMQDKTLALIGDSVGRQQFQSLMCMVTGGKESPNVLNVGWEYGLIKARGAKRPDGWAYRFLSTNTTILYYWSASLCELEPLNITDPTTDYAMHLDRPAAFLHNYLHRFDVVVLNTGHHWNMEKFNANRWIMYVGGSPNTNIKFITDVKSAKNFTIHSVAKWLDAELQKRPRLKAFFRTISPRHFANGDWNTGGTCDNRIPLTRGKEVLQDKSSDPVPERAVKGTGVKLLDITAISELRDEGHISRYGIRATTPSMQDCLHWCLPGIPDTWNEILFAQL